MIAFIALVIQMLVSLIIPPANSAAVIIPPMPKHAPTIPATVTQHDIAGHYCLCDECCYQEFVEYWSDEFTALFNSYSYKLSKNGRSMVNGKFVKMGAK